MSADLDRILKLEVPIIVQMGQREMAVSDVMSLVPGSIIELPKSADDELELMVNNRQIGTGRAVKVGENFGIKVTFVGDVKSRISAMGTGERNDAGSGSGSEAAPVAGGAARS